MVDVPTRYYITITGKYIGGFAGNHGIKRCGWIEVSHPPAHALDTWDGTQWVPYVPPPE